MSADVIDIDELHHRRSISIVSRRIRSELGTDFRVDPEAKSVYGPKALVLVWVDYPFADHMQHPFTIDVAWGDTIKGLSEAATSEAPEDAPTTPEDIARLFDFDTEVDIGADIHRPVIFIDQGGAYLATFEDEGPRHVETWLESALAHCIADYC